MKTVKSTAWCESCNHEHVAVNRTKTHIEEITLTVRMATKGVIHMVAKHRDMVSLKDYFDYIVKIPYLWLKTLFVVALYLLFTIVTLPLTITFAILESL